MFTRTAIILLLSLLINRASAESRWFDEWFLDVYGGLAFTQGDTLNWEVQEKIPPGPRYTFSSEYDSAISGEFALRFGGWLKSHDWLALAGDLSFFNIRPDGSDVEIDVTCLSLLCMARYAMLADDQYEHGRLQPYLAAGPVATMYFSPTAKGEAGGETITLDYDPFLAGIGVDLRLGCTWMLFEKQGMFIEYRYSYIDVDAEDDVYAYEYSSVETELSTHHLLVGVTFRY